VGLKKLKTSYSGVLSIFSRYWRSYGGIGALLVSPYFHLSLLLSVGMTPFWLNKSWWDTALSTLPNLLGFTLAGFTIWLGFGDEKFRNLISKSKPEKESPFMGVSAAFAHFVVIQLLALLAALWALAMNFPTPDWISANCFSEFLIASGHFFGFFLFVYSLMSTLAATMGVFRAASWYDSYKKKSDLPAANSSDSAP
jgi:hypothetical protein